MHGMVSYFVRRVLLIPVTFVCITFLVYALLRAAPVRERDGLSNTPVHANERGFQMAGRLLERIFAPRGP